MTASGPAPRDVVAMLDGHRLVLRRRDLRIIERPRPARHAQRATPLRRGSGARPLRREYQRALIGEYRRAPAARRRPRLPARDLQDGGEVAVAAALAQGSARRPSGNRSSTNGCAGILASAAPERMWPVLSGAELVNDLLGFAALIHSAADGAPRDEERLLFRERVPEVGTVAWTEADLPLVDEADAILGPPAAAPRPAPASQRGRRPGGVPHGRRARRCRVRERGAGARALRRRRCRARHRGVGRRRGALYVRARDRRRSPGPHCHAVAHDCPPLPVGLHDPGGRLRAGESPGRWTGWSDVLAELPDRAAPHEVVLSVNYRTPAEIMDFANRLLPAAPEVEPARPVRSTSQHPVVRRARGRAGRGRRGCRARRGLHVRHRGGDRRPSGMATSRRVARSRRGVRHGRGDRRTGRGARAARSPRSSSTTSSWSSRPTWLPPIVLGPAAVRGAHSCVRTLTVVHSAPLPEALELAQTLAQQRGASA